MKLNLGCSDQLLPGYVNVDVFPPCDQTVDLTGPWPWSDSSVEEIRAHDIVEHLPNKIHTMNEAWRVLKPGGRLDLKVPTTAGSGAFQDPQHVSYWTPNDLFYYCSQGGIVNDGEGRGMLGMPPAGPPIVFNGAERRRFGVAYGIMADFRVVAARHALYGANVWYLEAILEAVK